MKEKYFIYLQKKFSNSLILDSKVFYQELKNLRILFVLKEKNSLIL